MIYLNIGSHHWILRRINDKIEWFKIPYKLNIDFEIDSIKEKDYGKL